MTRMIGFVPVRVGRSVVPVPVEAESGAHTHFDLNQGSNARIVVPDGVAPDVASREVEAILPEIQQQLTRKLLN